MSTSFPGIRLYRAILKEHRRKLPPHLRMLGDKYIKEEFRSHKDAKPEFLNQFFASWSQYLIDLKKQTGHEEIAVMSDDQREQLLKLREESVKTARGDSDEGKNQG